MHLCVTWIVEPDSTLFFYHLEATEGSTTNRITLLSQPSCHLKLYKCYSRELVDKFVVLDGIFTTLYIGWPCNLGSILAGKGNFLSCIVSTETLTESYPASCSMDSGGSFSVNERTQSSCWPLVSLFCEVNACYPTSAIPYSVMEYCLSKQRMTLCFPLRTKCQVCSWQFSLIVERPCFDSRVSYGLFWFFVIFNLFLAGC